MQIDPTRWLVSVAGFLYDWLITREWRRVFGTFAPLLVLCCVYGLVWWGQTLDQRELAQWYMDLGDREIAEWEKSWADVESKPGGDAPQTSEDSPGEPGTDSGAPSEPPQLSQFADMLFRRVQLLAPSDRSQYVIGAALAQGGAIAEGRAMLTQIAPDNQSGYAPAHAFLGLIYLDEFRRQPTREMIPLLKHHMAEALRADQVPSTLLKAASDLYWMTNDKSESLRYLQAVAERDPSANLELAKRARTAERPLILEQAYQRAEKYFKAELSADPKADAMRVALAELYANAGQLDAAEELLQVGEKLERTPRIARGLSEVNRIRFNQSVRKQDGVVSANVQYLDFALRHDPTNPAVVEDIAKLARMNGPQASEKMIRKLQQFLAEGKATAATHAWLAESYLIKENYEKALPHLEQVVIRSPSAPQYLNNLAYVIADLHPDRLEEALQYANRSVAAAREAGVPNADYYDTMGTILAKLDRGQEAITAFETAIELKPFRKDFHERAANEYEKQQNMVMAENHRQVIRNIEEAERAAAEAEAQNMETGPPEGTPPSDTHSQDPAPAPESPGDEAAPEELPQ